MIFVKTTSPYSELSSADLIDHAGNTIEDATIVPVPNSKNLLKVSKDGREMIIQPGLYEVAQLVTEGGDPQVIKIDFSHSKARRISINKIGTTVARMAHGHNDDDSSSTGPLTGFDPESITIETTRLRDINFDPRIFVPVKTGTYLDSFLSYKGGILPGINIMVTGDPGVGKSSNLMDICVNVLQQNSTKRVLYISAEMNELDVKEFEQYYPGLVDVDFLYISNYVTDPELNIKPYQALLSVLNKGWDVVIMDSFVEIQSLIQEDLNLSSKRAEKWMLDLMKKHNSGHNKTESFTTFLAIQQMTKGGNYVGSKRLEHMTTAYLTLCWDRKEKGKRYMMFEKNRKGKEKIKLYYSLDKTNGIVYDETRHSKELLILDRLQTSSEFGVDEFDITQFEKLFEMQQESASI